MKNKKEKGKEKFRIRITNKLYNLKISKWLRNILDYFKNKVRESIRFEIMIVFLICFLISLLSYSILNDMFKDVKTNAVINYDSSFIDSNAQNILDSIEHKDDGEYSHSGKRSVKQILEEEANSDKVYVTDMNGKVLYKSNNASEEKIDIFSTLKNISEISNDHEKNEGNEQTILYPVTVDGEKCFLIYKGIPHATIVYEDYQTSNSFLALVLSIIIFTILFLIATNRKTKYLDEIAKGIKRIADGDLSYNIEETGNDEIANIAVNVNNMAREIDSRIKAQQASEQTKADLITNVSHDLRTPLTSIMGYIGLIKDRKYENQEKMEEYLNIAYNKSEKLKVLIEDLFEYTKLNNNGMKIEKAEVNLVDFVAQVSEEMKPYFEEHNIEQVRTLTDQKIIVSIDPGKMVRVLENLLTNAVKYSFKPGVVIIGVYAKDDYVTIAVKNRGESIPQEKLNRLFDRFYRVDESRSADLGGSGLGLAISKSIVEIHGGNIWGECYGNDISFYIRLKI